MAQLIPLSDDARQTFRIILGGSTVRLRVWWQPLDENWYLSLAAPDTTPIISGVRVDEAGAPLTARQLDFEGGLLVDGQGPVRRRAWTTTHKLLYLTEAEVAAHAARRAAAPFAGVGYPGAPASFAAVGRYRSAALSFRAGAAGASAITGWQYRLRMEDGSYGDWIDIPGSGAGHHGTYRDRARQQHPLFRAGPRAERQRLGRALERGAGRAEDRPDHPVVARRAFELARRPAILGSGEYTVGQPFQAASRVFTVLRPGNPAASPRRSANP